MTVPHTVASCLSPLRLWVPSWADIPEKWRNVPTPPSLEIANNLQIWYFQGNLGSFSVSLPYFRGADGEGNIAIFGDFRPKGSRAPIRERQLAKLIQKQGYWIQLWALGARNLVPDYGLPSMIRCWIECGLPSTFATKNSSYPPKLMFYQEKSDPLSPMPLKSTATHLSFLLQYFSKSMLSSWQNVVFKRPHGVTMLLPFVFRYFCISIRVRGCWNTPKFLVEVIFEAVQCPLKKVFQGSTLVWTKTLFRKHSRINLCKNRSLAHLYEVRDITHLGSLCQTVFQLPLPIWNIRNVPNVQAVSNELSVHGSSLQLDAQALAIQMLQTTR